MIRDVMMRENKERRGVRRGLIEVEIVIVCMCVC